MEEMKVPVARLEMEKLVVVAKEEEGEEEKVTVAEEEEEEEEEEEKYSWISFFTASTSPNSAASPSFTSSGTSGKLSGLRSGVSLTHPDIAFLLPPPPPPPSCALQDQSTAAEAGTGVCDIAGIAARVPGFAARGDEGSEERKSATRSMAACIAGGEGSGMDRLPSKLSSRCPSSPQPALSDVGPSSPFRIL
eukprot:752936-Hanusia_phi.AAC.1